MTHLIQILLPITDNTGQPFQDDVLRQFQAELVGQFNGLTAYSRAPAKGVWRHDGEEQRDNIIVVEVMTERIDHGWWQAFRQRWETKLGQEQLIVRVQDVTLL